MYRSILALAVVSFALAGCRSETSLTGGRPPVDSVVDDQPDYSDYDGATLVVHSPISAEILFLDEGEYLDAEVLDADGLPMDFDQIVWESDQVDGAIHVGLAQNVDLPYGIHQFTVTAELPNGDRLQTIIGGVRVQSRHTGIYSGQVSIDVQMDFQGTPVNAQCVGALDFAVDMAGEAFGGAGGCSINLVIVPGFDVAYNVDAIIDGDDLSGDIGIDVVFFNLPLPFQGGFVDSENIEAGFEGGLLGINLSGGIAAHRVSPYVDPTNPLQ